MDYVLCKKCQTSVSEISVEVHIDDNYYCTACYIEIITKENMELKAEVSRLNDRLDVVDFLRGG